jgi:hypothetical protein
LLEKTAMNRLVKLQFFTKNSNANMLHMEFFGGLVALLRKWFPQPFPESTDSRHHAKRKRIAPKKKSP